MRAVPVFMYHHINWHQGNLVTLTPDDFENHLQILRDKKVQTLFLDELMEYLRGDKTLTQPTVALTFDDGHLDNWVYAFPLLQKYRMKATIFVITSWMGSGETRPYWHPEDPSVEGLPEIPPHREVKRRAAGGDLNVALRWEEAQAMEASGLVDIQSHTHLHQEYFSTKGKKFRLNPEKRNLLLEDLGQSQKLIEKHLGKRCRILCWPWGKYDEEALAMAKGLGFEATVTTEKGVNFAGSGTWRIKRVVAKSGDKGWFSSRLRIYSNRFVGQVYSRTSGII